MSLLKQIWSCNFTIILVTSACAAAEPNISAKLYGVPVESVAQTLAELTERNLVVLGDPSQELTLELKDETSESAIAKFAIALDSRVTRYPHVTIVSDESTANRLQELATGLDNNSLVSMTLRQAPLRRIVEVLDKLTGEEQTDADSTREQTSLLSLRLVEVPASEVKAILNAYYGTNLFKVESGGVVLEPQKSPSRRESAKVTQSKSIAEARPR